MSFIAQITVDSNDNKVEIINPHYPINGRMCTLEDLFVEYNQLNLLNNSYRLLEPEKDLCPSVGGIYNDDLKVYYIEEDLYQDMQKEDSSIIFYNYTKSVDVSANEITANTNVGIYTINGYNPKYKIGGFMENSTTNPSTNISSNYLETFNQLSNPGYVIQSRSKYANYWAVYMKDDVYTTYIKNRMIAYFKQEEVTENDVKDVLFNILATKIREQNHNIILKEKDYTNAVWRDAAEILADFFNDVFLNMKYKNEYVFYSVNTPTGIKALNIIAEYWKKIYPDYNPDQTKCRFTGFEINQDQFGWYIKTLGPITITKYMARKIKDVDINGNVKEYIKYINMDDVYDMAIQLMHWIQKNFIYLPYHIPNIGVNTNGSQQLYFYNDEDGGSVHSYKQYDNQKAEDHDSHEYTRFFWRDGIWQNYLLNETKSLIRMCDIQPGYFMFSDETSDYSDLTVNMSNTAFLYNQTNTSKIADYALSPDNYITVNAELEKKYYPYICYVDIGENSQDVIEVKPASGVKYTIQKTFYERVIQQAGESVIKEYPLYNIAFIPTTSNTTGNIKTYTSTIKQKLSGITKTIKFNQYPTQFIVFPSLNELSSKYYYEIESFSITSPVVKILSLSENNNVFTSKDIGEQVAYQYRIYKIVKVATVYYDEQDQPINYNINGNPIQNQNDTDSIYSVTNVMLQDIWHQGEGDESNMMVKQDDWKYIKRLSQNTNNIYYLLQYITESSNLTADISMEISIAVYDRVQYNSWREKGYWVSNTDNELHYHQELYPMNKYEVTKDDSCNIIINFYEVENYISKDNNNYGSELVNKNINSLHKYVAGRTDMTYDSAFNTMNFSKTKNKTTSPKFTGSYTTWMNGRKIVLKIMQHIADGGMQKDYVIDDGDTEENNS